MRNYNYYSVVYKRIGKVISKIRVMSVIRMISVPVFQVSFLAVFKELFLFNLYRRV